ncbi:copper resistance CopC family protein [Micromonospora aurantiaca (nom. illeg.)]|uniref:copper resistance CopC family protein n=1 Tax=Micromonospora aurantiaca (nom. illeg.) TaxID=47850 RepID=UPI001656E01C|nr:copper resistance CopC family protein [Micromonospora aurantiaca]MBC9002315.1 copper resistance protein CopC [Micromonospora aurantiaca]
MTRPHRLVLPIRVAAALCALAALLVPATPAWAHNALRESTPAANASVAAAPRQIDLIFAERLDPRFTTIAVTAPGDVPAVAGKPSVSGARATAPLKSDLPAGRYTVAYRVVSVDGHPVQDSYTFTVTDAAATPAASAPASSAPTTPPSSPATTAGASTTAVADADAGDEPAVGAGLVAVLLVLGAAGVGLLLWRMRAARR